MDVAVSSWVKIQLIMWCSRFYHDLISSENKWVSKSHLLFFSILFLFFCLQQLDGIGPRGLPQFLVGHGYPCNIYGNLCPSFNRYSTCRVEILMQTRE